MIGKWPGFGTEALSYRDRSGLLSYKMMFSSGGAGGERISSVFEMPSLLSRSCRITVQVRREKKNSQCAPRSLPVQVFVAVAASRSSITFSIVHCSFRILYSTRLQ